MNLVDVQCIILKIDKIISSIRQGISSAGLQGPHPFKDFYWVDLKICIYMIVLVKILLLTYAQHL